MKLSAEALGISEVEFEALQKRRYAGYPDDVMRQVRSAFATTDHHPDDEQLAALRFIPETISNILQGKAARHLYVCPVATGVGKSQTLAHSVKALHQADTPWAELDVGVCVCVERYDQILAAVEDMGLREDEYAAYVADAAEYLPEDAEEGQEPIQVAEIGLGKRRANEAAVLFTSHAMIHSRVKNKQWADVAELYYLGRPRPLRVWDEAMMPGMPIALPVVELHKLIGTKFNPMPVRQAVSEFLLMLLQVKNEKSVDVPDFSLGEEWDRDSVLQVNGQKTHVVIRDIITTLFMISGKRVRVRTDADHQAIVSYDDYFPADLYPLLVLDASADARKTYHLMEKHRKNVTWGPNPVKRYERVRFFIQHGPAGKRALENDVRWARANQVVNVLRRNPDTPALVLYRKPTDERQGNVPDDVAATIERPRLTGKPVPLKHKPAFLNWGRHTATNQYRDRSLIIMPHILFLPAADIEAKGRLAGKIAMGRKFDDDDFALLRNGQVMADLQQGLTRGAMRLLDGNQAHACDVYVTVSDTPAANVGVLLATLFPDAQFFDGWGENAKRMVVHKVGLSLQDRNIVDYLEHQDGDKVTWPKVYEALGIAKSHFSAAMKRPRLQAAVEVIGWEIVTRTRPNYFRRAVATEPLSANGTENGLNEHTDRHVIAHALTPSGALSVRKASGGNQGVKKGSSSGKSSGSRGTSHRQSGIEKTAAIRQKSSWVLRRRG